MQNRSIEKVLILIVNAKSNTTLVYLVRNRVATGYSPRVVSPVLFHIVRLGLITTWLILNSTFIVLQIQLLKFYRILRIDDCIFDYLFSSRSSRKLLKKDILCIIDKYSSVIYNCRVSHCENCCLSITIWCHMWLSQKLSNQRLPSNTSGT